MMEKSNLTMLTDFYEITMANGYFCTDMADNIACFDMFFRRIPDDGGYAIMAGLEQVIEYLENLEFTDEDIEYLRKQKMFSEDFLKYLSEFKFTCDVWAIPEGTPIFPGEPILTVRGPVMQAQFVETMILLIVNHQSLIATKASRIVRAAAGRPVMEFGTRRAHGTAAAVYGARAAYIGGCAGTACTISDRDFGIPALGTMAHSWVQMYDDEYEAFKKYAEIYPTNCVLLVDTYNVLKSGVPTAIRVFKEMKPEKMGIRIDSGDITYLTKQARKMLDEAGLEDCSIVISNSLDEYLIRDVIQEGACIDSFGVGERLITAKSEPVFGGVYKLSATRAPGESEWTDRLKISESAAKLTTPGVLDVRRYYQSDGRIAGDMVFDVNETPDAREVIVDPMDDLRQKNLSGLRFETLLRPLARAGKVVLAPEDRSAMAARARACVGLETLDETQLRMLNPHTYPVGLELGLNERRRALVAELRHIL
mgnify:CR=1 FL=1